MKVIICGGRDYTDRQRVYEYLDRLHAKTPITHTITGGARGADDLGHQWSIARGISAEVVAADWTTHGKRAGYLRNVAMADRKPDFVVAFPGGVGTDMMVKIAIERKIPGVRVNPRPSAA